MEKIIIVGAGPAGCYLAQLLKKGGIEPLVLEEDNLIGQPVKCAGILGQDVFEDLKFKIPKNSVINTIDGAIIHYKNKKFSLKRENVAFLVNRDVFDQTLAGGLNVKLNTRFLRLEKQKGSYLLETNQGKFITELIVGADGPTSLLRNYVEEKKQKVSFIFGYQITLKNNFSFPKNIIEVYFTHPFHEFVWLVPEKENILRIGAMGSNPKEEVKKFLDEKSIKGTIIKETGGLIPIGLIKTVKENIALLGDAACQVKPLSGGGIYYGLKCAEILADCILYGKIKDYDKKWKKNLGNEIKMGFVAREIFSKMKEKQLDYLFDILVEEADKIEKEAEFELHSSAFKKVIKNPKIFKIMLPAFFIFIMNIFSKKGKIYG